MENSQFLASSEATFTEAPWGNLTWFASAPLGNSDFQTVGRCVIYPHQGNPLHSHPNCEEVLVLLHGRIAHTIEDGREIEMSAGDTISIPAGVAHCARNLGGENAEMMICFSSAHRQFQAEEKS